MQPAAFLPWRIHSNHECRKRFLKAALVLLSRFLATGDVVVVVVVTKTTSR
jgi:hypothetical protein